MHYSGVYFLPRAVFHDQIQQAEIILDGRGAISAIFNYPLRFLAFFRYNSANKLKRGLVYDYWYP